MSTTPISSFYAAHPAFETRAQKDPSFDHFVSNNVSSIQFVFDKTRKLVLSLKHPDRKEEGKQTLQGPVFTIIQAPTLNFATRHFGVAFVRDEQTPPLSNEEDYTRRVEELSEKIAQSLDKVLSELPCDELNTYIKLADSGMIVNFFAQPHASWVTKYLNIDAVEPDGVRIKITTTSA